MDLAGVELVGSLLKPVTLARVSGFYKFSVSNVFSSICCFDPV